MAANPRSFATLLQVGPYDVFNGNKIFTVTPEKDHQLTVQVKTEGAEITVKAKKSGALFYSASVTIPPDGKVHTYKLIDKCNGGDYDVLFQSNGVATFIAYILQTQYVS